MLPRCSLTLALLVLLPAAMDAQTPEPLDRPSPIRVGVLNDNFPFSFQADEPRPVGFVVDLLREIEVLMSLPLERRIGGTQEINRAFREGELEVLQSFAYSPERDARVDFSVPYLRMTGTIFVRPDLRRIRSLSELQGRRVLVHRGSVGEQVLRDAGLGDSIQYVESVEQAFRLIADGQGDATLASRLTGLATIHHTGIEGVVAADVPVPGYVVRYCFAVQEGDAELLAQINEGLAILHSTGRYEAIYRRWFGRFDPARFTAVHVLGAVALGLALALGIALWAIRRERALHRRIQEQSARLATSETRLRRTFHASPEALLVVSGDPADLQGCELRETNPAAVRLFGWANPPAMGRTLRELAPDQEQLWRRLATEDRVEMELAPVQGETRWVRSARVPLETGRDQLLVLIDVTEAKQAAEQLREHEQQLRQVQSLEALGTLSSGIAHDFNNILSSIIANAQLAQIDAPEPSPVARRLEAVVKASLRARELVRRVLAFSRHSAPHRETLPLAPIVDETLEFIRAAAPTTIELKFARLRDAPWVNADPVQVHQVLMNLCTNAVQAMGLRPGRLTIREDVVRIAPESTEGSLAELTPGEYVRLSVADTGPGIPEEILPRIFEPFFTTKAPGDGSGLGLSVVHGILRAHQGAVTVRSGPGQGTEFQLYFPISDAEERTPPVAAAPGASWPPRRVLLVDDEEAIVEPAGELLRREGCDVSTFTNPVAAVRHFEANPDAYDLVICDLTMPVMTGLEVVSRLRARRPGLAAVIASGYFGSEQRSAAADLGVDAMIDKPLTRETLRAALVRRAPRTDSAV